MFSKDQFTHCKLGHDEGSESSTADHTVIRVSSSEEDHLNTNNNRKSLSEKLTSISNSRCLTASFSSLILFTLILISVVLGRQYIIDILIYIDSLDVAESTVLFAVMFTVVAFPIMWGYVLLNVACGYTYGFKFGTLMTSGCAAYAILCAHLIIRKFFKGHVERNYITNTQTRVLMEVVSGTSGYKIVFLTRLTPIPFGVQNAIFAVSSIKTLPYLLASTCGLLFTQSVFAYMGSTFRSMTQVLNEDDSLTTWTVLIAQVFITIGLTAFVIKLAKNELEKKMPNKQTEKSASVNSSSQTENTDCQTLQTNSFCVTDTPAASIPRTISF